ncbi:MAG: aminodeoxychorismate synthase component I [Burkholderiales bacterium]
MPHLIVELPYREDTGSLFDSIADEPWAVFLDSGRHLPGHSRFDILASNPTTTLITRGKMTEIRTGDAVRLSPEDPFNLVRQALGPLSEPVAKLPFAGGAIGYFAYDLGRRLERLPSIAEDAEKLPEMAVGLYDWACVIDHHERRTWLVSAGRDPATAAGWPALVDRFATPRRERYRAPFRVTSNVSSNLTPEGYAEAFRRVQRYIANGDCYQVNLAQRFAATAVGDPWVAFQALRVLNPAPFAAYLNLRFAQILSASPERFLRVQGGAVETKPIKGTRPRAGHPRLDAALAELLKESEKDRAENVMIVDLLRNDLSKTCAPGSVRVPKLFDVESFATVHHLVSTVSGQLQPQAHAVDLLRGCFPGGSITGAPKLRAMEIIEELEPNRRGVYCGSIGYLGYDGAMDTNIAIRTLVNSGGAVRFWAGGGIVADSRLQDEYQESFDKAAALLRLLQQCADNSARA